jgi:hypothetical protein
LLDLSLAPPGRRFVGSVFFLPLPLILLWLFVLVRSWRELRLDAAILLAVLVLIAIVSDQS